MSVFTKVIDFFKGLGRNKDIVKIIKISKKMIKMIKKAKSDDKITTDEYVEIAVELIKEVLMAFFGVEETKIIKVESAVKKIEEIIKGLK